MSRRFLKTDPVTPHFALPKVIRSRRQYVTWTNRARDILIRHYRFPAEDFIRIGKSEPSLNWCRLYPKHWERKYSLGSSWLEKLPRGAIIYWRDGLDICSEPFDPRCPVEFLAELQHYTFDFDFSYPEDMDQDQ